MSLTDSKIGRRWGALAGAGVWFFCGLSAPAEVRAATDEVPPLEPGQEKVLYLPLAGETLSAQKIRQKELPAIARFLRGRKIVPEAVVVPVDAAEVYLNVEPELIVEARAEACNGLEETNPAESLRKGQELLKTGDADGARQALANARKELPCSRVRLSRQQVSELLLWSGLAHPVPVSDEAQAYLRAGLSADPLIGENPELPPNAAGLLQKVAYDLEHNVQPVDLHLPQGEGEMWTHKNLFLDGRRIVFDKLFLQVTPGIHYVQITLPDEKPWGAFLHFEVGTTPDLADEARTELKLKDRYRQQIERTLATGQAPPALLQGFRVYAARLKRDQFYLAAITEEADGTWITVRRFHNERGIEVPELSRLPTEHGLTASVPLALNQPFALEMGLNLSSVNDFGTGYQSTGGGLEVNTWYLLPKVMRAGISLGLGGRAFDITDASGLVSPKGDLDITGGLVFGAAFPLGRSLELLPDLGYLVHAIPLRGLPMFCTGIDGLNYQCGLEREEVAGAVRFNLREFASGPRARLGLGLKSFSRGGFTLRGMLRAGYSPLLISFRDQVSITLTTTDSSDQELEEDAHLSIDDDSRALILHQIDVTLGIHGTY